MNRHHVRTARWIGSTPVFVATVAAAVVLILATIDFLEARGSRCYLGAYFYNKDRKIGRGAYIREECDTNFWHWLEHSAPFGNWGVNSKWGSRRDANQFRGWKRSGRQRQWNSCTPQHRPPDPEHYNAEGGWSQKWDPESTELYASGWVLRGRSGSSCRDLHHGGVWTSRNNYMKLYELDLFDRDSKVATLSYSDARVRITCSGAWDCRGDSGWKSPTYVNPALSKVSAKINVHVRSDRR